MVAPLIEDPDEGAERRLDDWYLTIAKIYVSRNFHRSPASLFSHLVETCGGLSRHARADWVPLKPDSSAKAIAWWFALLAKVGIRSAEDILWTKFPGVCPYCLLPVHDSERCEFERKRLLAAKGELAPEWNRLRAIAQDNINLKPVTFVGFAEMFLSIYGGPDGSFAEVFARLGEELGELAEAVRVVEIAPHYFVGEAPDVFAWLIQCHALIAANEAEGVARHLESLMLASYPDCCSDCGTDPCSCPPVRRQTLGRLAVSGPAFESHFGPGGMFLPLDEMLVAIATGAGTVTVAGRDYRVDAIEIQLLLETVPALMEQLNELSARSVVQLDEAREISSALSDVRERLDSIWFSEAVSDKRLVENDERLTEIEDMLGVIHEWVMAQPGPVQQQLLTFLNSLASGALLKAAFGA